MPDSLGNLVNLEHLYIGNNDLLTLPFSLSKLINLKYFYLGRNELMEVPSAICNMTRLKELDLSYCGALGFLPSCLKNIALLDVLIMDASQTLPFSESRFHNPSLKVIIQ